LDQAKGAIAMKVLKGEAITEEEKRLLRGEQKNPRGNFVTVDNQLFDVSGDKPELKATVPRKPEKGEKLTGNVGINPKTGKEEYLMTDGSFSGTAPGSKPGVTETPIQKRVTAKSVGDTEVVIQTNKSKQEAQGKVDYFNQHAEKPYAYQWKPGKLYGGTWTQTKLPVINKKQVTAKDVYDTAAKHGMTYEEVLAQIMENK
jgi:hypothetical protein